MQTFWDKFGVSYSFKTMKVTPSNEGINNFTELWAVDSASSFALGIHYLLQEEQKDYFFI